MPSLPIDTILPKLKETVSKHPSVVLHAPPGAGKTTRVPLALLDVIGTGRIVMLEPRRIAAASAARWMAKSLGEEVGQTIGYTIRFDSKTSSKTRVEVVTEGILTRRLQTDPGLSGVAMVIFDEFHERSIHADLALALSLDVQKGLRSDLKLLVMSATIDTEPIAKLLGNAPVVSSQGKLFPVEERYIAESREYLQARVASAVRTALRETNGDVLVFLPGAGEIRQAAKAIEESLNLREERLSLHPLYGDLPFDEQERAILPSKEFRKIVLATNIAETSLTIEGVQVVIDSGLTRTLRFDPSTGMNRLVTGPVSRASAEQRKGRAGRLGPGVCYRLYGSETFRGSTPFAQPEILQTDLAPLALELLAWGVKDPNSLSWLDAPPASAWNSSLDLLRLLNAVDPAGSVTPAGREMAALPLHPRLARLLLLSRQLGASRLGADLAALLSERDIFRKTPGTRDARDPDILSRVEAMGQGRSRRISGDLDVHAFKAIERTSAQLFRLLRANADAHPAGNHAVLVTRLLLAAYPDRICKRRDDLAAGSYVLRQGRAVRLPRSSHLLNEQYLIVMHADAGEGAEGVIHLAAAVPEELIRSELGNAITTERRVGWDRQSGRINAAVEDRLGQLVLSSRPAAVTDDELGALWCELVRTGQIALSFSAAARQLQARVALVKQTFPEEAWPDISDQHLLAEPEAWLLPWLTGVRTAQALSNVDLAAALKARLSWDQQRLLDSRAPLALTVPSGSRISLDYASGELPVLAVKLQELFGLADTPQIADGRVAVLLHLLSPARRPVQITRDLRNFWNAVYPDVKKDLKGRYPKHPWPDDPWNAPPTRKTKPRK